VLLWLVLPILGIIVLSQGRPLYEPRFLMLVLPAWTILVGAGLVALGRAASRLLGGGIGLPPLARQLVVIAVSVVVAGLLSIPTARSLASYYFDPAYARDDYRGLAQTITLREQPGDAIILTAPGQIEVFGYYYRGRSDLFPLPHQRPIDPADTLARLETLSGDHDRVWLVRWAANEADPDDLILGWLEGRGRRLGSQQYGRVELQLYDLRATARVTPHPQPLITPTSEFTGLRRCAPMGPLPSGLPTARARERMSALRAATIVLRTTSKPIFAPRSGAGGEG
jgi:hypothetical protein